MVNEYASSSEYGGGPSPGYSGAGGGEAGSAYAAAASPSMGITLTSVQLGANAPVTQLVASRQDGSNTYYTEVAPTPASTISPSQVAAAIQQPTVSALQRSDYTPIQQLGDTRTQQLIAQGYSPVQSLLMQTNAAKETPGLTDDRYYANELQKAAQNYVAVSSEYHAWGKSTGVPVAANKYEYTGDLALGFLKGTEGKSAAQVTTPTDLSVLGLPGGRGIQDVAWGAAIGSGKLDYTGFVNAANVISRSASEQQMGPYGALASTAYIDGVGYRLTVPEQQAIAIQAAKTAGETIHPERLGTPWVIPSDIGLGSAYRGIGVSGVSGRLVGGKTVAGIPTVSLNEGISTYGSPLAPGVYPTGVISPMKLQEGTFSFETPRVPTGEIMGFNIPVISDIYRVTGLANVFENTRTRTTVTVGKETILPGETVYGTPIVTTKNIGGGVTETVTTTPSITTSKIMQPVSIVSGEVPGTSGWDRLNESIRSALPSPAVGEKIVGIASVVDPLGGKYAPIQIGKEITYSGAGALGIDLKSARETSTLATDIGSPYKGQYTAFYEQPLLVPASFAIGGVFGTVAKGVEGAYMGVRAATAETIISKGGMYRAAEQYGATIMGRAPQVLGAVYALDIGGRVTKGYTEFTPESVSGLKGIAVQEVGAMTVGFGAGAKLYEVAPSIPSKIIEARVLAQPTIEAGIAKAYIGGMNLEAGLMEARVLAKPKAEVAIAEMYMKGQRIAYSIPEIIPYGKSYVSESIAGGKQVVSSATGTVGEGARGVLYDYSRYTGEIAAKNYLTPSQKIDKAIVGLSESSTGILTPERMVVFDKSTGEMIHSNWGDIYYGGRFLSSAALQEGAMQKAMLSRGIEPYTAIQTPKGVVGVADYSQLEILHTHPVGTNIRGMFFGETRGRGMGYLELPSRADISLGARSNGAVEGSISPQGVFTYSPTFEPKSNIIHRSYLRASAVDTPGFETSVGKTFAESMQRYGSGKSFEYRTIEDIRASLPEGTTLSPTVFGYAQSKIYPAYFEAKLAVTTPVDIALGRAEISGKSFVQEFPGRITRIGETIAGKGEITVPTTIGPLNAPLLPTHGEIVEAMYAPRLSKILAPSTFGERAPMPQLPSTGGERRGGTTTTTSPATPGFDRVVKTSKGFGLAKEPSMKSMGQSIGTTQVKEGVGGIARTTDFRGRPTSPTMKPMGEKTTGVKQATGVSLLSERLPVVEGMTTARVYPSAQIFTGAPSLQQQQRGGLIQVIEPALEFSQTSAQRQRSSFMLTPALTAEGATGVSSALSTGLSFAEVGAQAARRSFSQVSTPASATGFRQTGGSRSAFSQIIDTSLDRGFTNDLTQRYTQTPRQTTRQIITTKPILPEIPIPPPPFGPGGIPSLGGGGSGGGIGKRRRNFLEEFRMGLDISFYGGTNTPRSPLPKFKGIPGSIQRKQTSPSAFKRKRKKS